LLARAVRIFVGIAVSLFLLGGILILFLLSVFFLFWQENMLPDVSVADVAAGKDMQGIPWEKMLFGRDQYREMKMKNYRNYQNLSYAREDALQVLSTYLFCTSGGINA